MHKLPGARHQTRNIMAEFKFSCPKCNQRILCDVTYSGMQINCPVCQQAIVVPQAPPSADIPPPPVVARASYEAPPPPVPPSGSGPSLATRQSTATPATGRRFAGVPDASGEPLPKPKSKVLRNVLVITACVVALAVIGVGGWFGFTKLKGHGGATKGNPAATVATPTANQAMAALGILTKVHSAYTNFNTVTEDGSFTMFVSLTNLTIADTQPGSPAAKKTPNRRPAGMPRTIEVTADYSVKKGQSNWVYFAVDGKGQAGGQSQSMTMAYWSAGKGMFMFQDPHMQGATPTYIQMSDASALPVAAATEQVKKVQEIFSDPAQISKIIKDLGQTEDEPVAGQDCYTLTAKVLGQKVKVWVNKSNYMIAQAQITLGGMISDADIDDAFSLVTAVMPATGNNVPPQQLDMVKSQLKTYAPAVAKVRGTLTSTTKNIQVNPTLTADDFVYQVPKGVRLTPMITVNPQTRPAVRNVAPTAAPAVRAN